VSDGVLDTLILPHVNSDFMQLFLDEVAARRPKDRIVMILDGAGWRQSSTLKIPKNMLLISLPTYAPELNPVEHLWDELLREKALGNVFFDSIEALEEHLDVSLKAMALNTQKVHSIAAWPWFISALLR
jgi:transposase